MQKQTQDFWLNHQHQLNWINAKLPILDRLPTVDHVERCYLVFPFSPEDSEGGELASFRCGVTRRGVTNLVGNGIS